jgi:hypothetical protein
MDGGWCPVEAPATLSDPKARPAAAITEPAITGSERLKRLRSRAGLSLGDVVTASLRHASTLVIRAMFTFGGLWHIGHIQGKPPGLTPASDAGGGQWSALEAAAKLFRDQVGPLGTGPDQVEDRVGNLLGRLRLRRTESMNSVAVTNGYMVETAMPSLPSSARATAESMLRPALDALYAPVPGRAEKEIPELTLTMLPAPWVRMSGPHGPHERTARLHGDQGRDQVELEDRAEVIRIDLTDGRLQPLTGHVDQDVDPSERIRRCAHRRLDLTGIRDVTRSLPSLDNYHLIAIVRQLSLDSKAMISV